MDHKYFGLVELVAFSVIAFAFLGYQIWSVRRKNPDDAVSGSRDCNQPSKRQSQEK